MTTKELTAYEQAIKNVQSAEDYLRTMTEARKDAEYREKNAKSILEQAKQTLESHRGHASSN